MSERVTVTPPRTAPCTPARTRPAARGPWPPAAPAGDGLPDVRALMRAQGLLALLTCALVGLVIAGLPLLFAAVPGLSRVRVFGIRLPWLVLCGAVQPVWIATARRHVRLAERVEQEFAESALR